VSAFSRARRFVVLEAPYSCRKRPSISAVITFGDLEPWMD
jgi:hypothetical protein